MIHKRHSCEFTCDRTIRPCPNPKDRFMSIAQNRHVRAFGGAVATAAIPAVVLGTLATPAVAAPLPTRDALQPRLATPAMVKAAEARISAHLVASQIPTS